MAMVLLMAHFLVIDMDPPVIALTGYWAKDEGFYVAAAYNYFETGSAFGADPHGLFGQPVLTNLTTYCGLVLFGDNFTGLRSSSVFFGALSLFLFQVLLYKVSKRPIVLNLFPIFLVTDLQFTFASIVVEPTIARVAMLLLTWWWLVREWGRTSNLRILVNGVLLVLTILLTYPNNAFLVGGYGLMLVVQALGATERTRSAKFRSAVLRMTFLFLGVVVGLAAYFGFSWLLGFDETAFMNNRGDEYTERVMLTLSGFLKNLFLITTGGQFRTQPVLLLLLAICPALLFIKRWADWDRVTVVGVCLMLPLVAQCGVLNDYPIRKLLVFLPIILVLAAAAMEHLNGWLTEPFVRRPKLPLWLTLVIFASFSGTVLACIVHFRGAATRPPMVLGSMWLGLFFLAVFLAATIRWALRPSKLGSGFVLLVWMALAPNVFNLVRHLVYQRSYAYRDLMLDLGKLDSARFMGGWSHGFRSYNDMEAQLNIYQLRGGRKNVWESMKVASLADDSTNYSIGYAQDAGLFEFAGFEPFKRYRMVSGEDQPDSLFILYKEVDPDLRRDLPYPRELDWKPN